MSAPTAAVIVRPATRTDAAALGRLGALLVRTHHEFDAKRFMSAGPGTEQGYGSFLASQIGAQDVLVLVAELAGDVVGYTYSGIEGRDYMSLRGPAGVLHDIIVDPAHRGRGIGEQLLRATLATLEQRGMPQTVLWTAQLNEPAKRLFARAGFRQTMIEMTRETEHG